MHNKNPVSFSLSNHQNSLSTSLPLKTPSISLVYVIPLLYHIKTAFLYLSFSLCHTTFSPRIPSQSLSTFSFTTESLPLVTTLVAIIGGIVFLVVVVVVIVLFKKKGRTYKDPGLEKNSMRSSDLSSTHDSVLKVETRTATGSDLSPSEEEDYSSHDDWESGDGCGVRRPPLPRDPLCYSAVDYTDTVFPLKDHPNNNTSGGYIKYYSRDYDPPPPPPLSFNRNSIYTTNQGGGAALNNVDPRYSAAYGNPYLRVPSRTGTQGIYGSSGGLDTGTVTGGMSQPPQPSLFVTAASQPHIMNNNNNNNTLNNTSAIYGQNRNNLRLSANLNNQYITMPQGDGRNSVHGTHI
ncbi:hypothetical protein E2C01_051758 [Portunus trituberculatus]|uniref:Uncharacterized protein n=1 Tax=Portunus trituberculatus TaxID=210409 RepID=A0A5B7GBW0_PORTR|nr:hypothetical protein [Portunus trituberculatus]